MESSEHIQNAQAGNTSRREKERRDKFKEEITLVSIIIFVYKAYSLPASMACDMTKTPYIHTHRLAVNKTCWCAKFRETILNKSLFLHTLHIKPLLLPTNHH